MERPKKRFRSDNMQGQENKCRTTTLKSEAPTDDHGEDGEELQLHLCMEDLGPVIEEGVSGHVLELNATPEGLVLKVVCLPDSYAGIC